MGHVYICFSFNFREVKKMSFTTPNEKTPIVSTKAPGSVALQVFNNEKPDNIDLHNPFNETIDQKFWIKVMIFSVLKLFFHHVKPPFP